MPMPAVAVAVPAGHLFHGHDASFHLLAAHVLKLNGGVTDVESLLEQAVNLGQNARALRRRNIGDGHVTGQRAGV